MAHSAGDGAKKSSGKKKNKTADQIDAVATPVGDSPTSERQRHLIGIGASAGGLEALSALISALPTDLGVSYVVVQHLSPTHRSMLVQLLGRETAMVVREVEDGAVPEADVIYVAPASRNVVLREGRLVLLETVREALPRPSVNAFLSSLASGLGEDAIGVILSGTGSDGTVGLREIKAAGGFTFAQEPNSAKYAGMPQSAIDAGCVDWVLPPEQIAAEIASITRNRGVSLHPPGQTANQPATTIKKLLLKVKQYTRIDFGGYKEATIWRRIERRMAANHVFSIEDYFALTETQPEELDRLAKDILISVTAFFRDPEAFEMLAAMLPSVLKNKQPGDEIRVWVPGCATGEEAYSIAMLLSEALGASASLYKIQIFATDLDNEAMNFARRGLYSEGSLAELKPAMLSRYFQAQRGRYEISRTLREMVVFARQDLVQDPPFLRLDLISCRNVLIYLKNDLQAKIFSTFHYGLRPGGYLLLGKSEGVFQQDGLFDVVDKSARLFRRRGMENRLPAGGFQFPSLGSAPIGATRRTPEAEQQLLNAAISRYLPATLLINGNFEIQHIYGDISPFVAIASGKPTLNLQHLIRRELRTDLQLLQHQAEHKLESAHGRPRPVVVGTDQSFVRLAVHPLEDGVSSQYFLVSFEHVEEEQLVAHQSDVDGELIDGHSVRDLEDELTTTRERLQTVIEELETSNEEMQALNEEVQAANEELQSSNEELEAANEELQSTNEELTTVNEELQIRSNELAEALNDLEQVQNAISYPLMVCNDAHRLVRFNAPAAALFNLGANSLHQPLSVLNYPPGMDDFAMQVSEALSLRKPLTSAVFSNERNYLLNITPYGSPTSNVQGVIITLVDDTDRLARERELRREQGKLMAIIHNAISLVSMKDLAGRYEFVNRPFEQFFGIKAAELLGKTDAQVMAATVAREFRDKELEVLRSQDSVESTDIFDSGNGRMKCLRSVRFPLVGEDGLIYGVCTQSNDLSAQRAMEGELPDVGESSGKNS